MTNKLGTFQVATDAIGMGLNLNIRRIIFNSLARQTELIPNYQALQIAGRAGRLEYSQLNLTTDICHEYMSYLV